jgi:hypothetical protein
VLLELRFGRPDKAQPPSGNGAAVIMPDGADAYPAYAVSVALFSGVIMSDGA